MVRVNRVTQEGDPAQALCGRTDLVDVWELSQPPPTLVSSDSRGLAWCWNDLARSPLDRPVRD